MISHPFRLGLIGLGWAGEQHARAILSRPDRLQLVAAADIDPDRLASFTARYKIPHVFKGYPQLLQHPDLDGVIISLPHSLHAEAAVAALQIGRHVLVEKPLASTLAEAGDDAL